MEKADNEKIPAQNSVGWSNISPLNNSDVSSTNVKCDHTAFLVCEKAQPLFAWFAHHELQPVNCIHINDTNTATQDYMTKILKNTENY